MALTLANLNNCFDAAIEQGAQYIGVMIKLPGQEKPEVIINKASSFAVKRDYYNSAYNEDLTHKQAGAGISIVGFTFGDSFSMIAEDLFGPFEYLAISTEEIADFVVEKTGIDKDTVTKVLDAEGDYYVEVGIAEVVDNETR
jgi:hypothetical protein